MEKIRKQENKRMKYVVIILLFMVIAVSIVNLYFNSAIVEKKSFYAKIIVSDIYGFDLNKTALTFGAVMPGGSASRDLIIENKYNLTIRADIYSEGKIKEFLSTSENNFILRKDEKKNISFIVSVPNDAEFGDYDGQVYIIFRK